MEGALERFFRLQFAPPRFLSMPTTGIDISVSGIKVVSLKETTKGLVLDRFGEHALPEGAIVHGEIVNHTAVIDALKSIRKTYNVQSANITLPEARTYLFDADVAGKTKEEWRTGVEQHLDEYIPLPPGEVLFDVAPVQEKDGMTHVAGVGVARRIVDLTLSAFDEAGIGVEAVESETFAIPRALLPKDNQETVLIIDFGRMTTKLIIASHGMPLFATTLDIGGHAITIAIQKHAGVSEEEAKKIKAEQGLVVEENKDGYLDAMISTVSVIRDEIVKRLDYWQDQAHEGAVHAPVTRAILVGGNASLRGFPEYLESTLHLPVELGDVFINLAGRDAWLPEINYTESLAYATGVGLALRRYMSA